MTKTVLLIDVSGYLFRAFYALPLLTRQDGTPVNAVLGCLNMFIKLFKQPNYTDKKTGFIFDVSRKTFRNELYTEYKTNRKEPPKELIPQFSLIREAVIALGCTPIEKKGFEADDLMASYVVDSQQKPIHTTIISSDKDLLQLLVYPEVTIFDPLKDRPITLKYMQEKWGITPSTMIDFQALCGDSSDNIPGVKGIGPKTAAKLLNQYTTLDNVYAHMEELPSRTAHLLQTHKNNAFLSKQLATLYTHVPLPMPIENWCMPKWGDSFKEFAETNGFHNLLTRLQISSSPKAMLKTTVKPKKTVVCTYPTDLGTVQHHGLHSGVVALNPFPFTKDDVAYETFGIEDTVYLIHPALSTAQLVKEWIESPEIQIIGFNIKPLLHQLQVHNPQALDDLQIMHYIGFAGLKKHTWGSVLLDCGFHNEDTMPMCAQFLDTFYALSDLLTRKKLLSVYSQIDRPLISILYRMEQLGVHVDIQAIQAFGKQLDFQLQKKEQCIYELTHTNFNIDSPSQTGVVLFEKLKLPTPSKTKTGKWATDAIALTKLAKEYPVVQHILDYRQLAKLRTTYIQPLLDKADNQHIIHTTYLLTSTQTGRLSSINPNVQNLPIRTNLGKEVRNFIIPRHTSEDGRYVLIGCDYNQIELRILAVLTNCTLLKKAFTHNEDIHALVAKTLFHDSLPLHTARRLAKTINFGIIYGMSAYGLAERLHIDPAEAKLFINQYFKTYPEITAYIEKTLQFCKNYGYVTTLFGRKLFLPNILSKNYTLRTHTERQAINGPIQGTAADLIKRAMYTFQHTYTGKGGLILQIHDELLASVPSANGKKAKNTMIASMISAPPTHFDVILTVSSGIGENWNLIHEQK